MKLSRTAAKKYGFNPAPKVKRPTDGKTGAEGDVGGINQKLFAALCHEHGLPAPVFEYPFSKPVGRKHKFDVLFDSWLALEVQGGIFTGGRHVQGPALLDEYEKLNLAVILGYAVLLCVPSQIDDGSIFPVIKAALASECEQP